jgi:nucleoporin NUP2
MYCALVLFADDLLQNFNMYDGLEPALKDKTVSFVGRDEAGLPVNYNIRVKTVDQASELKTAIDREVKLVKKAT